MIFGVRRSSSWLLAALLLAMTGCNRTPAHLDAVPRPTGTAEVIRFEIAWGEDGLNLDEAQWRRVEALIEEGRVQWERWVRVRWIPFAREIWSHQNQDWQEDSERVADLLAQAEKLREEALAIDMTLVARIGMVAGPQRSAAAELFADMRRLERANALAAGYSRRGTPPNLPEGMLVAGRLPGEVGARLRDALAATARKRAILLEAIVEKRFAMDLAGAGDADDEERRKALREAQRAYSIAISDLEEANDAVMDQALDSVSEEEKTALRYQWLRETSDPDEERRKVGEAIYEMIARSRTLDRSDKALVRESQEAFARVDLGILENFRKLRADRTVAGKAGRGDGAIRRKINALRRERGEAFWGSIGKLKTLVDPDTVDRVVALARDLPDINGTIERLVPMVGAADAEAIVMRIPASAFGEPEFPTPQRLIRENVLEMLLPDPMNASGLRDALLRIR